MIVVMPISFPQQLQIKVPSLSTRNIMVVLTFN